MAGSCRNSPQGKQRWHAAESPKGYSNNSDMWRVMLMRLPFPRCGRHGHRVFVPSGHPVKEELDHAALSDFTKANLLDVELYRLGRLLLIAPERQAVVRLVAPVRRPADVVGC